MRTELDCTISARIAMYAICKLAYRPEIVSHIGYTILKEASARVFTGAVVA